MINENLSFNLWAFWKSINFNNHKRSFLAFLIVLLFGLNAIAQPSCSTSSLISGQNYYDTPVVGTVFYDGDGWFFIYDQEIWVYISANQNFCSSNFWFYTPDHICGYTGWFYTSGPHWIFNQHSGWIRWNCSSYKEVNPNQNNLAKTLEPGAAIPTNPYKKNMANTSYFQQSNAKIGITTTTNLKIEDNDLEINVYPNPLNDQANITYNLLEEDQISINVYDANGKLQINLLPEKIQTFGKHKLQFDVSNLPKGIYYLSFHQPNNSKHYFFLEKYIPSPGKLVRVFSILLPWQLNIWIFLEAKR